MFHLKALFPESYQVISYYNDRNHGESLMEGIWGCAKNMVFRAVLSQNVVIYSPEDFARYGHSNIQGVLILFRLTSQIKEELEFIRETLT